MFILDSCSNRLSNHELKSSYQQRKLHMLQLFRDSLERRLSSVNASISTLKTQIERDSKN